MMHGRVVIPIRNSTGELVAYAGRAVNECGPKYKLPIGFRKSLEVYNLHRAATASSDRVIVVEGYFDCLRVHQAGFRDKPVHRLGRGGANPPNSTLRPQETHQQARAGSTSASRGLQERHRRGDLLHIPKPAH
jgi:DNA primase